MKLPILLLLALLPLALQAGPDRTATAAHTLPAAPTAAMPLHPTPATAHTPAPQVARPLARPQATTQPAQGPAHSATPAAHPTLRLALKKPLDAVKRLHRRARQDFSGWMFLLTLAAVAILILFGALYLIFTWEWAATVAGVALICVLVFGKLWLQHS